MGQDESTQTYMGPEGTIPPEEIVDPVYCDWWLQLPDEEEITLMVKGDNYRDPRSSYENEGVKIWVPQDSPVARFLFALDSEFCRLHHQVPKFGARIRHVPEETPPPLVQEEIEKQPPRPTEMEKNWQASQESDKKDDDALPPPPQPRTDIHHDVEGGTVEGEEEDIEEEEEDPLYDDDDDEVMPARLISGRWVIATLPEYQHYKVFISMKATQSVFFVVLEKYLRAHKQSRDAVLRGTCKPLGEFLEFARAAMGSTAATRNGLHTPALHIDLSQMERLNEAYQVLEPETYSVYEKMYGVYATAKRIIDDSELRKEATVRPRDVTIKYSLLAELDLKIKKFEEQASGLFEDAATAAADE